MKPRNNVASKHGGKWITKKRRAAIYDRDNLRCAYCGKYVHVDDRSIDHLQPQELGGSNASRNLVLCCLPCNSAKGKKSIRSFFFYLRNMGVNTKIIANRIKNRQRRKLKGNFKI